MITTSKRLALARRIVPSDERERWTTEWSADRYGADEAGFAPDGVDSGLLRAAVSVRVRSYGQTLLGTRGVGRALLAWLALVVLAVASFMLGGIILGVAAVVALATLVALTRGGLPTRASHFVMVVSVLVGFSSFAFAWWAWGAMFDAADNSTTAPAAARYGGLALIVWLSSVLTFLGAAIVGAVRERARRQQR